MRKSPVELNFIKVKGHTGVDGNEEADRLEKKGSWGDILTLERIEKIYG
jgi:ribonuclease HI